MNETSLIDSFFKETASSNEPSTIQFIYYLLFEHGVTLKEIEELPLPYIIGLLNTHAYIKSEEEKAMKKANRRR